MGLLFRLILVTTNAPKSCEVIADVDSDRIEKANSMTHSIWQRRRLVQGLASAPLGGVLSWTTAHAQSFPDRPIRIIPFGAAGGPIDIIARLYGDKMRVMLGQPVIVDPKPGASGVIAADFVAKAPADGHTLLFTLPLTHINVPILNSKTPYDPLRDFAPLSMLGAGSPLLLARADAPYGNLKEFVAFAKSKPGTSYGTWGIGSGAHLYGELLKRQAAIEIVHVPYRSEQTLYNDLFGGQLAITWANPGSARIQLQAGKVRLLGVTGSRRMGLFPSVPTFGEQGFAGFETESWIGAYATAKTPQATIDKLVATLREITRQSDVQVRLVEIGFDPLGNTPEEFLAQYKIDYPRLAELIKAAGVTPE
jgi:tripartite-type tricarboxylate transporter receptor subunit TctC